MRRTGQAIFACLLLFLASPPDRVAAEEEPPAGGLTKSEARRLRGKLRSRAADWWSHRKKLASKCSQCKGSGRVRWRRGRRWALVECPKCDGQRVHVDKDHYRVCYYERRSPGYRLQDGIRDRLTQDFIAARRGNPFPEILLRYTIRDLEIVDATHGLVFVERNKESVARPQHWVWASERGKSATWYLYDAAADGPWPDGEEAEPPDSGPESAEPEPTPPAETPPPPAVAPILPEPAPTQGDRAGYDESVLLVKTWTDERNDVTARVIRIELGLEGVEGYEEKVATSRRFLKEIRGWLEEEEPAFQRARKDVVEKKLGVLLADRIEINTLHFKAHRRLDLVEKMLIGVVPDPRD